MVVSYSGNDFRRRFAVPFARPRLNGLQPPRLTEAIPDARGIGPLEALDLERQKLNGSQLLYSNREADYGGSQLLTKALSRPFLWNEVAGAFVSAPTEIS